MMNAGVLRRHGEAGLLCSQAHAVNNIPCPQF